MKCKPRKGFPIEYEYRVTDIEIMARNTGWTLIDHQENIGMLSFTRTNKKNGKVRINIYVTTMTVSTALNHPKRGKTQLFRGEVNRDLLGRIFNNPRVHSGGRGYYRK